MNSLLLSDEDLKQSCAEVEATSRHGEEHQAWLGRLENFLHWVSAVDRNEFFSEPFQRMLWDSAPIAGLGWGGAIEVQALIEDQDLAACLWSLHSNPLPPPGTERINYLVDVHTQCLDMIKKKVASNQVAKIPQLKLYNVLASLQPTEFATISFTKSLRELARDMGIDARDRIHAIAVHRAILDRLNDVLGPVPPPPDRAGVERMTLPWLLFERQSKLPKEIETIDLLQLLEPGAAAAPPVRSVQTSDATLQRPTLAEIIDEFPDTAVFPPTLIARLDASLWSNPRRHFAVLAGLSGAGKTLLARSYALALWSGEDEPHDGLYTLPVQPGWHDPVSLFGYIHPLSSDTYVRTGFLEFLLRASADPARPYTVVLDEMNLSHPEQYLAPLLSAMETGDDIELHTFDRDIGGVPPRLAYPSNLVIIGTVNMDETTHGLSDKILDRAAVLEFWDVDIDAYPGWARASLAPAIVDQVRTVLGQLGAVLRPVRLHFGWRSIGDILGYIHAANAAGVIDPHTALDHAIFSKILPKLRGEDSKRLRLAFEQTQALLKDAGLPESAAKLAELCDDLRHIGSARFWR